MKYYKEFLVTAEPFIPEILSSVLWELDIQGINEEVGCLKIFPSEGSDITVESVSRLLERLKEEKMITSYNIEENLYEFRNWNEEWEKSLPVINIDGKIIIKPTFREYKAGAGEIVIEIDPKMSFGTGDHQTTKLVLQLMQKYITKETKVLDAGTGTAILSIAAVKLGASSVTAFDNDEWSYSNARDNSELNSTADKIDIRLCEIDAVEENDFDLVLGNIQKNVLVSIADKLQQRVKQKGILILSGLLIPDEEEISDVYSSTGFEKIEKKTMDEWTALVFRKT